MEGLKLTSWPDLQLNMSKACRNLRSRRPPWLVEHSLQMIYTSGVRLALKSTQRGSESVFRRRYLHGGFASRRCVISVGDRRSFSCDAAYKGERHQN